ncbi:hypothetical protein V4C53_37505 [Paraburkholderia azotifigens]|uniref:hypothetical protein n=1 Tax=Paraburkholderia azotifigens TaxID=2057004 RepID=UPI00317BC66C
MIDELRALRGASLRRSGSLRRDVVRCVAIATMLYASAIVSACADANSAAPQAPGALPSIEAAKQKQLYAQQVIANRDPSASGMSGKRVQETYQPGRA